MNWHPLGTIWHPFQGAGRYYFEAFVISYLSEFQTYQHRLMALSMPATLEARSSAPQIAQSPMVLLGSWGSSNHSGFKIRFFSV